MNAQVLASQLQAIERSARVRRYHTETGLHPQSVGEHTYGVMWLVTLMSNHRPSVNLLLEALGHDLPEEYLGDVPSPTKKLGGIKEAFDTLEARRMADLGLPVYTLTFEESAILKLADLLDGCMYCAAELRRGNRDIHRAAQNYLQYTSTYLTLNGPDLSEHALDVASFIYNECNREFSRVFIRQ